VYGWLFLPNAGEARQPLHLAVECVRQGHGTPKAIKYAGSGKDDEATDATGAAAGDGQDDPAVAYESQLLKAYNEAKEARRGIHSEAPIVRIIKTAGDTFEALSLVNMCQKVASQKKITCVIEYIFDGSRFRVQIVDPDLPPEWQYATFTLLLAGVLCPRIGNPKADPPIAAEPFGMEARLFVEARLLQRELPVSLVGTDKVGANAVGTVVRQILFVFRSYCRALSLKILFLHNR